MLKNSIDFPINSWKCIFYQSGPPVHGLISLIITETKKKKKKPGAN